MEHTPFSIQSTPWRMVKSPFAVDGNVYARNVDDGILFAIVANEPVTGWHMSISFRTGDGKLNRYPSWDELAHAREELLPEHIGFAMMFPPSEEYVNLHPTTFHLYQYR